MDIKFSNYQVIEGGICAVKGFQAAGVHCGIRKNKSKLDLVLYCPMSHVTLLDVIPKIK